MQRRGRLRLVLVGALLLAAAALALVVLPDRARQARAPRAEVGRAEPDDDPHGPRRGRAGWTEQPLALAAAAAAFRDRTARTGTLEGRVFDLATGEPVAEAELTFSRGQTASSTIANLEGEFLFRASEPDSYELASVMAEGYLPWAPEWGHSPIRFRARPGVRVRGIVVYLSPAVEYEGRVEDPTGRPVEGAEVTVLAGPSGHSALVPLGESYRTDRDGAFRFTAPELALVEARAAGFAPGRARVDTSAQITGRLRIRLRPGEPGGGEGWIAGLVVDGSGGPVAEALVSARFSYSRSELHASAQAVTDGAGRFELPGLDAGRYDVEATRAGLAPGRARAVETGRRDLRLVLGEGAALSGTVVGEPTGEPVASFSVVIQRPAGPLLRVPYRTVTVFDAEGRYEVTGLEPGRYAVLVTAQGFAPAEHVEVTLAGARGARAEADFRLRRGGLVSGRVTSRGTGEPIAGARISLEGRAGREDSPVPVVAVTVTGPDGRFEMAGLAEGFRSVVVTAAHHHRRIVSGLQVREGGDVGPVEVDLSPVEDGEEPELELTGIGAVLQVFGDGLGIRQVVPGGGAAEAGLGPGDVILAIEGVPALELGFEGSIERIRGPENTTVRLTVRRRGQDPGVLVLYRRRIRA